MSVTFLEATHNVSGLTAQTTIQSTAANHAAGNALLVWCGTANDGGTATVSSVTNTASDTFVGQASAKRAGDSAVRGEWWYVLSSAGNASDQITVTWSAAVDYPSVVVIEISYTATLSFDIASTSTSESAGTSYPVQTFSTADRGIIVIGVVTSAAVVFTPSATPAFTGTGDTGYGTSYRITSTAATSITPTTTGDTSADWAAVAMSLTEPPSRLILRTPA